MARARTPWRAHRVNPHPVARALGADKGKRGDLLLLVVRSPAAQAAAHTCTHLAHSYFVFMNILVFTSQTKSHTRSRSLSLTLVSSCLVTISALRPRPPGKSRGKIRAPTSVYAPRLCTYTRNEQHPHMPSLSTHSIRWLHGLVSPSRRRPFTARPFTAHPAQLGAQLGLQLGLQLGAQLNAT